jgi:hypothetical protein
MTAASGTGEYGVATSRHVGTNFAAWEISSRYHDRATGEPDPMD